ncbi:MAG TPA: trypsin-like peptidase domain-containing protein [Candidatus Acidoferrales bacterium]|nr:trypsin-like peptidase domain-containing protein [Candidatus Acidoferrales bacterium]
MQKRTGTFQTLAIGLTGAIIGSFSMMVYASSHFANVAGPGNTPPLANAAPLEYSSGGDDQQRIINAVRRVEPSVVALNVTVNGTQVIPADPFAQFFFGQPGQPRSVPFHAQASGSGFVFERDGDSGFIVTNAHVVNPPQAQATVSKIEVVFANGDRRPGTVFAANLGADLALVKVDGYAKMPPPIPVGDSDKLQAGQWAIAIGEPFELKQTVTVGVVSGFNRDETIGNDNGGAQEFKGLLQTSAPINPGNSGGPLIDMAGDLIGVNQSTANPQAGAQGIGFAIPANVMKTTVALLEKTPGVHQGTNMGYIGAALQTVTPDLQVQLNYHGKGAAVAQVVSGSPADQAGLQPGDVILKINDKDVNSADDAVSIIKNTKPGDVLNLQVWSAGIKRLVSIKTGERPADIGATVPQQEPNDSQP